MKISENTMLLENNEIIYWKNQEIPNKDNISLFTDESFPPNIKSILGVKENENGESNNKINSNSKKLQKLSIKWKRPSEIFKNKKEKFYLFKDVKNINKSNIKQGNIADCYFISSLIALSFHPQIIFKLFKIKSINQKGYYEIILFIEGQYQIVVIDDYLPVCTDTNELCFSRSIMDNEIWICLLEKAWAKINGGYENIIKGYAHHVLEALTGFPSVNLMHSSYEQKNILDYIINSLKNKYVITSTTKDDLKIKGLDNNHTYALIGYYKCDNINIIKLRDPNGNKIIYEQNYNNYLIMKEKRYEDECGNGILYINFEEYYKYFSFTNICYIINNSYSKKFIIEGNDINKGNIFNIYLKEDCILSINVIKKNKRLLLPSFICLVKYNPKNIDKVNLNDENNNLFFNEYYSNTNSHENININKELKSGYYLFYSYINYNYNNNDLILIKDKSYIIKFDSNKEYNIIKKPYDIKENGFPILKNIKIQEYLYTNKITNYKNGINFLVKYKNKDLVMKIIFNPNNKWLKIVEDCSEIKNIFLLSPYQCYDNILEWYVPPNKFNILLGMVIDSSMEGSLNLKSKNFILKNVPIKYKNYEIDISKYASKNFN